MAELNLSKMTIKLNKKVQKINSTEKKVLLNCTLISQNKKTVAADVWAFRVYDSSKAEANKFFN